MATKPLQLKKGGKADAHGGPAHAQFADEHGEHEDHSGEYHEEAEPWLVSYADLMTLLFGFFAMLFTYASFDDGETIKMRKEVAKFFGGTYITAAAKLSQDVKLAWGKTPYQNDLDLKVVPDGLEINFITSVLFESGSAQLDPRAIGPLNSLVQMVIAQKTNFQIRVEGHTDDNPIGGGLFPSNWELSAARAARIVRLFEEAGYPAALLSAAGYGSGRPILANRDADGKPIPDNQAHNRRVVVKVILPPGESRPKEIDPPLIEKDGKETGAVATPPGTTPEETKAEDKPEGQKDGEKSTSSEH